MGIIREQLIVSGFPQEDNLLVYIFYNIKTKQGFKLLITLLQPIAQYKGIQQLFANA